MRAFTFRIGLKQSTNVQKNKLKSPRCETYAVLHDLNQLVALQLLLKTSSMAITCLKVHANPPFHDDSRPEKAI